MKPTIPPDEFSRDHWTLLAYAFCRLGQGGQLEPERMRRNPGAERYPTRTRSGTVEGHDDFDCIVDLEAAGVLVVTGSGLHPAVRFTTPGLVLGQWLCGAMTAKTIKTAELAWEAAVIASGFDIAAAQLAAAAELSSIDAVMARIPALDKPTRWGNVAHAIQTAKLADELGRRVRELEAKLLARDTTEAAEELARTIERTQTVKYLRAMHEGNVECCDKDAARADEIEAGEHVSEEGSGPVLELKLVCALPAKRYLALVDLSGDDELAREACVLLSSRGETS